MFQCAGDVGGDQGEEDGERVGARELHPPLIHGWKKQLLDGVDAEEQYRKALELQEKLVADFPSVPQYKVELGGCYCNLATLVRDGGKPGDSLAYYEKAIANLRPVHEAEPRAVTAKLFLRNSHLGRARAYDQLKKYADAVREWDRVVELSPPRELPRRRASRALSKVNAGQVTELEKKYPPPPQAAPKPKEKK